MNVNLQFDFLVDKERNTITIKREFEADRQTIWDCHTKSELLDQWFAPSPFTTKTKSMNFIEGGFWLYSMSEPDGPEYWGRMDYEVIRPIDHYTALDGFCDEHGEINPALPRASWDVNFLDFNNNSLVQTVVTYTSLEALEMVIQMGMKEGLMSTLERLDVLLNTFNKAK